MKWRLFISLLRYAGSAGRAVYGTLRERRVNMEGEVMNQWSGVLTARVWVHYDSDESGYVICGMVVRYLGGW